MLMIFLAVRYQVKKASKPDSDIHKNILRKWYLTLSIFIFHSETSTKHFLHTYKPVYSQNFTPYFKFDYENVFKPRWKSYLGLFNSHKQKRWKMMVAVNIIWRIGWHLLWSFLHFLLFFFFFLSHLIFWLTFIPMRHKRLWGSIQRLLNTPA